jgi:hypothetical protein
MSVRGKAISDCTSDLYFDSCVGLVTFHEESRHIACFLRNKDTDFIINPLKPNDHIEVVPHR